jgi:hypothetical protein
MKHLSKASTTLVCVALLFMSTITKSISVDVVERAAGLTLVSEAVKASSKSICKTTKCEVIVRRFDDAQKKSGGRKAISAP